MKAASIIGLCFGVRMASEDAFEELMEMDRFAEFVEELNDDSIFNIDQLENLGEEFFGQRATYEQVLSRSIQAWICG